MKKNLIFTSFLLFCFSLFMHGQEINVNKKNGRISNMEGRTFALYFNRGFLPKSFSEKEDSIANAYSKLAGYKVIKLSCDEVRELRRNNSEQYFVVEIRMVNEKCKSRFHVCKKKREYSYYSFILRLSEKNRELASFNSTGTSMSGFDYITSFYALNMLLDGVQQGATWKNTYPFLNKNNAEISKSTLVISDDFANIPAIEEGCIPFPKNLVKLTKEEIEGKLGLKSDTFLYAYVCPNKDTAGKYFRTLIIDSHRRKIIGVYCWEKKL
ncbi:MAG: hypothetical protein JXB49_32970 [Bacteroidales bacterium]|nr:hypothetical protein [Bacteroidales bacterium]